MKILITRFPYTSAFGGSEKHTMTLVDRLAVKNIHFAFLGSCNVLLSEFKKRELPHFKLWFGKEPVTKNTVLFFPFLILYTPIFIPILLYYRLIGHSALYCMSLTEKLLLTPIARLMGYRVFFMEHTMIDDWLTRNPYRMFYVVWSRYARCICVSQAIKDQLISIGVKEKNVSVIYNGIDISEYEEEAYRYDASMTNDDDFLRDEEVDIDTGETRKKDPSFFVVGTVCRLSPEKGLDTFIRAIKIAQEFIPNISAIIVGDGPQKENLLWLTKQLDLKNVIFFTGYQTHTAKWIKKMNVFVLPSKRREAFGMVLLEAAALVKPIIATRQGGIPEVIINNQSGIIIEPKNTEMLAQAIINLYTHPDWRYEYAINARKRIEQNFTLDVMLQNYADILTKDR